MPARVFMAVAALAVASNALGWWGRARVPDWVKTLAAVPAPAVPAGTGGVVLLDETTTTVTDRGEIRTLRRRVLRILGTAGRDLGDMAFFEDSETRITSLRAWSINAKGEEFQAGARDAIESAAFQGELYADYKMKLLRIPAAEPGTVFAVEIEQLQRPYALQDSWSFQSDVPVKMARYKLVLPDGWSHEERWFNSESAAPRAAGNAIVWELQNVGAIKEEPARPSIRAIAGRMAVNFIPPQEKLAGRSHRTWSDVGRWYWSLAAARRATTPEIHAKAAQLASSKGGTLEKIAALAAYAQGDIRYVAIEIGIGGYQPHAAQDILKNSFGDCKDKVTLLAALLQEIGVESYYVLATTTRGTIDPNFPTAGGFNHAIIAIRLPADVPAKGLFALTAHPTLGKLLLFDPTDTATPLGLLSSYLQDNHLLVVTPDGGQLIHVPAHAPDANQMRVSSKLTLDAGGALRGEVRETRSGSVAARWRAALRPLNDKERVQYFDQRLSNQLVQWEMKSFNIENLDDPAKDLVFSYTLFATSYANITGGLVLVRPRVIGRKVETIVDLKERMYGYETDGPSVEVDEFDIALPPGLSVDELPEPTRLGGAGISYVSETKSEHGVLRYRREYRVDRFTVPRAELPELNRVFNAILADERSSAVLKNR